jgi:hypothetical protein
MIYNTINTINNKLNEFLKSKFSSSDNPLEMSNLLEQDGSLAISDTNKIIVSLINIERETAMGSGPNIKANPNNKHTLLHPPVFIKINVLFTSLFTGKNYAEGLIYLSSIIEYFQANPYFDHQNTPQLYKKINKLTFEMVNLDIQSQSHLWGTIGGKYMPSVLYKIRLLTFEQENIRAEIQGVESPDTNTLIK